jgi:xanthosine utilization system XapX-like protein
MTLAGLVLCGVCGPAFFPHSEGLASTLLILWDWGAGFATVVIATLIILLAVISRTRNLPSAPVVVASLFGALTLLVGCQIVQQLWTTLENWTLPTLEK